MIWMLLLACFPTDAEKQRETIETRDAMQAHYTQGVRARDAVVRGEVEAARVELRALGGRLPEVSLPADAAPYAEALSQSAEDAAAAGDLRGAAMGVSAVALACGRCHQALAVDPFLFLPRQDDEALVGHHRVALRLWRGLLVGTDAGFARAAEAAAAGVEFGPMTLATDLAADAKRFGVIAAKAAAEGAAPEARAASYGVLLGTCAGCHERAGGLAR